ncbi:hypothetical protein CWI39_0394p0010 [Hamiltosporidium magnivora]|uniref:Uncharacterized protein n=1 Tax=Hamiltosporidium magnivora TaxID=148818 RepID=A0A4V2JW79_9MICR|nr:hypothetical protein CWI39_0394p0010 [Hamiltosporidium magnivora]
MTVETTLLIDEEDLPSLSVIEGVDTHKQSTTPLKQINNEEDGVNTENTKNVLLLILDDLINVNEESELEEEIEMLKRWK